MDARLIAEGIENNAEKAAVRNLGVSYGQGYGIARRGTPCNSPAA
jgi:EAL domain-containing protein (putative c-di-GMP-specific phosphodiesterase class I)